MLAILTDKQLVQVVQVVQANYEISTTIHARQLFEKHTAATPSYEVVSMNDIVSSTVNLDEAIEKFTDITKPSPVVEEIVIRNDKVNVLQVAERTEPSFETKSDF